MHDNLDKFPNLFLAGAAKAGTTSLYEYLIQHPDIFGLENEKFLYYSTPYSLKEPSFLASDILMEIDCQSGENNLDWLVKDMETYLKLYSYSQNEKYRIDASVAYLYYPVVGQRIKRYATKNTKILISLRNPIYGVYSLYAFQKNLVNKEFEGLEFEEALQKDFLSIPWGFRANNLYYNPVKNYLDAFGRKNVKILIFEEWKKDTLHTLEDICCFLGIERFPFKNTNVIHNPSGIPKDNFSVNLFGKLVHTQNICKTLYKKIIPIGRRKIIREFLQKHLVANNLQKIPMKEETKQYLKEYYREDMAKLEELLGRNLSIWYDEK